MLFSGPQDSLIVVYNEHHNIPPQSGYYDIGPMIQRDAEPAWDREPIRRILTEHIV